MSAELEVNGGRIRKVTITEIEDEAEWNWPDPGNLNETIGDAEAQEKTIDEVYENLENVVQDWKMKLEIIIADGLKKIKKTTKEKKAMVKYLPGEGTPKGSNILRKAKESIIQELTAGIVNAMETTHTNLDDLCQGKASEAKKIMEEFVNIENDHIENEIVQKDVTVRKSLDMKNLMKELDALYQQFTDIPCFGGKVPIYNSRINQTISRPRNAPFGWWHPMATLSHMANFPMNSTISYPTSAEYRKIDHILQDFVAVQKPYSELMKEWNKNRIQKKETKSKTFRKKDSQRYLKGRKSIHKDRKEKEIKKAQNFTLKEVEEAGEKHYYVIRKLKSNTLDVIDMEDIFADWRNNFIQIKRPRSHKPRVRKLSHKQERKELLKEAKREEDVQFGPLTYSQMLKKNLKLPEDQPQVEDVFESWKTLFDIVDITTVKPVSKLMEDVDFFNVWKHNLHVEAERTEDVDILASTTCIPSLSAFNCGQPTIKTIQRRDNQRNIDKSVKSSSSTKKTMQVVPYVENPVTKKLLEHKAPIPLPDLHTKSTKIPDKKSMQVVKFVEKPSHPKPTGTIPLPDLDTKKKTSVELINATTAEKKHASDPTHQMKTKKEAHENANLAATKHSWKSLILPPNEPTGRGDQSVKTPEDIFLSWSHVFTECPALSPNDVSNMETEIFFSEWLFNLDEPAAMPLDKTSKKEVKSRETLNLSPKQRKKEGRKQDKVEELDELITTIKENRRSDFVKNAHVKDKKRYEATKKATGRKVK